MQVIREGTEQPEKRDIYEMVAHLAAAHDKRFTLGENGLIEMGIANGVVNLMYDNGDMHSLFLGSTDSVYIKHRKSEQQLIVVPDLVAP